MILSGTISTPTTSADMRPLINVDTEKDEVPLRSVRGQFGPLSVENIRDSLTQLVNTDGSQTPKVSEEDTSFSGSILSYTLLWKNIVTVWLCALVSSIFARRNAK